MVRQVVCSAVVILACLPMYACATVADYFMEPDAARAADATGTPSATALPEEVPVFDGGNAQVPQYIPFAPGTAIDVSTGYPVPGEYFNFRFCTIAYSFSTHSGRQYAVTASHCGQVGDVVWAGSSTNDFVYPAEPIGEFVYSGFYSEETGNLDIALIELNGHIPDSYSPLVMPTAVASELNALPDQVCKLGRMTGQTCGAVTHDSAEALLHVGAEELSSLAARADVCARSGDSGGPVYTDVAGTNVIVGMVSGTTLELSEEQDCATGPTMELSFVTIADINAVVERVIDAPIELLPTT